jgi:uncharacterized membrane-anchored protein
MEPDYLDRLIDEKLYYKTLDKLEEFYSLEQEARAKLPNPPYLRTNCPQIKEIREYEKLYTIYQKNREEYLAIEEHLDNDKTWQDLIDTYIYKCYSEENVPITLIKEFVFSKHRNQNYYVQQFEECVELLDWFVSKDVINYKT